MGYPELRTVVKIVGKEGTGTGVVLAEVQDGSICKVVVATAGHIADMENTRIKDGYKAYGVKRHPKRDLGIIYFQKEDSCASNHFEVAKTSYKPLRDGLRAWTVGYPLGKYYIGSGAIGDRYSAPKGETYGWDNAMWVFTWGAPGSSGSPVFVGTRVVGILVGASVELIGPFVPSSNRVVVIPIQYLQEIY